jgi:hypothetical protein
MERQGRDISELREYISEIQGEQDAQGAILEQLVESSQVEEETTDPSNADDGESDNVDGEVDPSDVDEKHPGNDDVENLQEGDKMLEAMDWWIDGAKVYLAFAAVPHFWTSLTTSGLRVWGSALAANGIRAAPILMSLDTQAALASFIWQALPGTVPTMFTGSQASLASILWQMGIGTVGPMLTGWNALVLVAIGAAALGRWYVKKEQKAGNDGTGFDILVWNDSYDTENEAGLLEKVLQKTVWDKSDKEEALFERVWRKLDEDEKGIDRIVGARDWIMDQTITSRVMAFWEAS